MIRLVMESIKPYIEAVPWVDRYGGLAYPMTAIMPGPDGQSIEKTFPFSDYVNAKDCHEESDRYFYLTPDDSKISIVYFEQAGDTTFSVLNRGIARLRGVLLGQQNFRLVAWVNLDRLGTELQSDSSYLAAQLWKAVDGVRVDRLHPDLHLPVTNLKWSITSQVQKSMAIFSNYSYGDRHAFLMYPFDFFAFNVQCQFWVQKNCIESYEPSEPVCVEPNATAVLASFGGGILGGLDDSPLAPL